MAKRLEYEIGVDASKGVSGLKQFSSAAKKELSAVSDELEDTSSNAEKVARVLGDMASKMETELRGAAQAADALGTALGPDIAGRADLDQIVADLNRMGLSFDEIVQDADKLAAALRELDRVGNLDIKTDVKGTAKAELADIEGDVKDLDGRKAEIDVDVDTKSFDAFAGKLEDLPGSIGTVASGLRQLGTVGGIGAAAAGAFALANNLAEASLEVEVLSRLTGDSLENASRLAAVWKTTGADVNDLNDVVLQLNGVLADSPELAKQIGINLADGATGGERFIQIVELIQAGTIDAVTASKLLGEEGVRQVARLTAQYDDLQGALDGVSDAQVFTEEERRELEKFTASMNELKTAAVAIGAEIGDRVVPVLQFLFDAIEEAKDAIEWLDRHAPEEAKDAGLSFSDIFSAPGEIFEQFKDNFRVLIGQGREAQDAIDFSGMDFGGGEFTNQVNGVSTALERMSVVARDHTLQERLDADAEAAKELAKELDEAARVAATEFVDAQDALNEMATVFHEMERREGAMQTAFDLGNAPVEAKNRLNDINVAISDLQATADEELDLSVKLDPDEIGIRSGFRSAMNNVRGEVQADISRVFAVDGADAARTTALSYIGRVTELLGGAFTSQEVAQMLGLENFEVLIDVALEQESLAEARAELQLLAGLPGANPLYVAQVQLALDAGTLSPQAASVLLAEKLGQFGLNVPTELLPADPGDLAAAKAEADTFVRQNPLIFNSDVATPDPEEAHRQAQIIAEALKIAFPTLAEAPTQRSVIDARDRGQDYADSINPIQFPAAIKVTSSNLRQYLASIGQDAGGTTPPGGGIAAEIGPEFARFPGGREVLLTGPTFVPPGTRVTSRKQTSRILRTRGANGVRRYDQGGIVGGPHTLNINVSAGVIGNRYDVMRTVERAGRDKIRLLGTRA